jgi:NitT/TauT family transport system substrate-binding protein
MNQRELRSIPRRRLLACGAAALISPGLAACSAPVAPLRVGCIVFPGYEDLFLARELGLLDERRVRLVELLANTDTLRALAAEQLEAAAMTLDELMTARADGVDLRAVLVFDVSDGADVVLAKAPISLATLAGKRVAVEDGAMGAVMLSALLDAAGLQAQQIRLVHMTLDRSEELFASGGVDVVVTADPWAARMEKHGAQRIFDSRAIPGRIVDVLAVRADALQSHAAALRHLLSSHFAARKLMHDAPQRCTELMAARLQTPAAEVQALFRGLQLPDLAQNRAMLTAGGTVDQTAGALQKIMQGAGLLPATPDLAALAEPRFLPL